MRWESLFADLEAQLDEADSADLAVEVADRTRREVARLRVVDRLRGSVGCAIVAHVRGCQPVRGTLQSVGSDWLLVHDEWSRDVLIPITALAGVTGLSPWSSEPGSEGAVAAKLDLRHALRALARNRLAVELALIDGSTLAGTVDRVGADFLELAEHDPAELRRATAVRGLRLVPTAAIGSLRGQSSGTGSPAP